MTITPPQDLNALLKFINNEARTKCIEQLFCVCERGDPLLQGLKGFVHVDSLLHLYIKPINENLSLDKSLIYIDGIDL